MRRRTAITTCACLGSLPDECYMCVESYPLALHVVTPGLLLSRWSRRGILGPGCILGIVVGFDHAVSAVTDVDRPPSDALDGEVPSPIRACVCVRQLGRQHSARAGDGLGCGQWRLAAPSHPAQQRAVRGLSPDGACASHRMRQEPVGVGLQGAPPRALASILSCVSVDMTLECMCTCDRSWRRARACWHSSRSPFAASRFIHPARLCSLPSTSRWYVLWLPRLCDARPQLNGVLFAKFFPIPLDFFVHLSAVSLAPKPSVLFFLAQPHTELGIAPENSVQLLVRGAL